MATPDNNPQATQAANQAYFNANPNVFGNAAAATPPVTPPTSVPLPTSTVPTQPTNVANPPATFYKPGATDPGYDPNNPQMVYNAQGQGLNAQQYAAQGGAPDYSNVKPGPVPQQTPAAAAPGTSPTGSFTNPAGNFSSADISGTTPPNYFDLYQQELQNRGVTTSFQQEEGMNQQIAADQNVLNPLTPAMVQGNFPASLQQLQAGGANQSQLQLAAAQASAPIATAMNLLIQSRSAVAQYITQQETLAQNAVTIAQQEYAAKLNLNTYDFTQIGQHLDSQGNEVPDYGYVNKVTGKIQPATTPPPTSTTGFPTTTYNTGGLPSQQIGNRIASKQIPGQAQLQYYDTQTGQQFSTPQQLADFYNQTTGTNTANAQNVFSLVAQAQGGNTSGASGTGTGSGGGAINGNPRTDANNNPIAASVAIDANGSPNMNDPTTAEWINALNATNIPYSIQQGNNFSGNRATISFPTLQNGIDGAITLLGTSAFNWYKNPSYGGSTALNGVNSASDFTALPYDQKVAIVKQLYAHEAGSTGQLFSPTQNQPGAIVPPNVQKYVTTLQGANNASYIDSDKVSPAEKQGVMTNAAGKIPVLTSAQVAGVKSLATTNDNLKAFAKIAQQSLGSGLVGGTTTGALNLLSQAAGFKNNPNLASFNSYREAAIKTIQGLASGGTGLRINQTEVDTAVSNMPNITDSKEVAAVKLAKITDFLNNTLKQTIPGASFSGGTGDNSAPSQDLSSFNFSLNQ